MLEQNPHRKATRLVAFILYVIAGFVLLAGTFFTLTAATVDLSTLPLTGMTNQSMAVLMASIFLIIALILVLLGRLLQQLFGQQYRQEKTGAKTAVGCLRLSSLGCALWIVLPALIIILTGHITTLTTNEPIGSGEIVVASEPAGPREIFLGSSGAILLIILMLSVAWFISSNYIRLKPEDYKLTYKKYRDTIKLCLPDIAKPEARAYMDELTREVLTKLDILRKSDLLTFLSESGLFVGETRIKLHDADFRQADLRRQDLPHADLRGINLEQATLQHAILFKVNLSRANLKQADLSFANLQGADLQEADLTGAILERANLLNAKLAGAKVTQEQLNHARL